MKLLIVEDNHPMRRMIADLVRDLAADVIECADGHEAVAAYRQHRPDWVLMDVRMAAMDGLSATRLILRTDARARVMIVTDYDDEEWREAARLAGACAYVLKENLLDVRLHLQPRAK